VCGVLGGTRADGDGPDRVSVVRRVENVAADRRVAYELGPAETLATIEELEADGVDVVGFYHSHPESDPVPSEADRDRATWTGYVYLICAPDGRTNAYRWDGSAFDRLTLDVRE
jgi:proteasome lid subunit RPN8/RPN11